MSELILKSGHEVSYEGKLHRILSPVDLEHVLLENIATHEKTTAKIIDLQPVNHAELNTRKNITDLLLISDADWNEAKHRETVLEPLVNKARCSFNEAKQAAKQLDLSWRQIYNLLKRYRDDRQLLTLIPQKSSGGKDKSRIPFITEKIITDVVEDRFLSQQRTKIRLIFEEIVRCCSVSGVIAPSERTVRRRIENLSQKLVEESQRTRHTSKQYTSVQGYFPETKYPHDIWQIDHTPG